MLVTAELHWESSGFATALPLLLQALALARQHHLQAMASETILHLAFTQVSTTDAHMQYVTLLWQTHHRILSKTPTHTNTHIFKPLNLDRTAYCMQSKHPHLGKTRKFILGYISKLQ